MMGETAGLMRVVGEVDEVASFDLPVLIEGDTATLRAHLGGSPYRRLRWRTSSSGAAAARLRTPVTNK
jgi:hypothetical protein